MRRCGQEDPLEQKTPVHSSTVAWKIPRTKEPSRLQSMGVAKGSDPKDQLSTHTHKLLMASHVCISCIYNTTVNCLKEALCLLFSLCLVFFTPLSPLPAPPSTVYSSVKTPDQHCSHIKPYYSRVISRGAFFQKTFEGIIQYIY